MSKRKLKESRTHTERFLLQRKENSVQKLEVFEVIVDHIVELEPLKCSTRQCKK